MHQFPELPTPVRYRYGVLEELRAFGVAPTPATPPRVPYQFLRALMTFEIRGLKARKRELEKFFGPQPLDDYARQVGGLREKYSLLRQLPREWVGPADTEKGLT